LAIKYLDAKRIRGLSSDTKPTNVVVGTIFEETNTRISFIFQGGEWLDIGWNYWGTGADGAVTISSNTDLGTNPTKNYTDLTINSSVALTGTGCLYIYCSGTCTVNGTINMLGKSGGTGGTGGSGAGTGGAVTTAYQADPSGGFAV